VGTSVDQLTTAAVLIAATLTAEITAGRAAVISTASRFQRSPVGAVSRIWTTVPAAPTAPAVSPWSQ